MYAIQIKGFIIYAMLGVQRGKNGLFETVFDVMEQVADVVLPWPPLGKLLCQVEDSGLWINERVEHVCDEGDPVLMIMDEIKGPGHSLWSRIRIRLRDFNDKLVDAALVVAWIVSSWSASQGKPRWMKSVPCHRYS